MNRAMVRGAVLFVLPLWLAACATMPETEPGQAERELFYNQRQTRLGEATRWELEGKLAVSNESDGGSGHFRWKKSPGADQMNFHGALGRGAWRLDADSQGAELTLADGSVYRSEDLRDLVRTRVGWSVPVDHLARWVRGLSAPGADNGRTLDERGRLVSLEQAGRFIGFGRYRNVDGEDLPVKVTARRNDSTVKLAIRRWTLGDGMPGNG
jgi:outer membrane lipoprotein LolB